MSSTPQEQPITLQESKQALLTVAKLIKAAQETLQPVINSADPTYKTQISHINLQLSSMTGKLTKCRASVEDLIEDSANE